MNQLSGIQTVKFLTQDLLDEHGVPLQVIKEKLYLNKTPRHGDTEEQEKLADRFDLRYMAFFRKDPRMVLPVFQLDISQEPLSYGWRYCLVDIRAEKHSGVGQNPGAQSYSSFYTDPEWDMRTRLEESEDPTRKQLLLHVLHTIEDCFLQSGEMPFLKE